MSKHSKKHNPVKIQKIHDKVRLQEPVKIKGHVEVSNRVKVDGRVQIHGHVKTSVSGQVVNISGQVVNISGQVVNISGQIVNISGQPVITNDLLPIAGDWNGDGTWTIGLYQVSTKKFFLKNTNASGAADISFTQTMV